MLKSKSIVAAVLVVLALSAGVFANGFGHTMYLTFNRPVALPGVSLGAGTYTFERVNTASRIDLVRVVAPNHRTVYLGFTYLVERPRDMKANQWVTFREAKAGVAPQIATWFPEGERTGHQFIY